MWEQFRTFLSYYGLLSYEKRSICGSEDLFEAVKKGNLKKVNQYLEQKADPNTYEMYSRRMSKREIRGMHKMGVYIKGPLFSHTTDRKKHLY